MSDTEYIELDVQDNSEQLELGVDEAVIHAVSPKAYVTREIGQATITVTDIDGTSTATVYDGQQGAQGERGPQGERGEKGDKGDKGDTGETGQVGPVGPAGPKGDKGDKGDTGSAGSTGPQGEKGDKGDTGNGIASITKTGTQGLVDTYTITYTDGTTSTFTVTNGQNGSGSGTVTQVSTGVGLTGGPITSSGTIKANLKSETASSRASNDITSTQNRQYAVNLDSNSKLSVNVPWENTTYESKSASSGGTAVSLVTTGEKYTWNHKSDFSGNYSDLNGKPILATVATTGDYDDLTDKPTIPTVPTNVSAFTNDAGYLTTHQSIKTINSTSMTGTGNVTVQPTLVSGTNIKTVNSTSLLGSGNVAVQPTLVSGTNIKTVNSTSLLGSGNVAVQPTLVSGTNIKTVNNESLLGSGNITIQGGAGADVTQVSITVANWNATTTCTKTVTGVTTSNSVIVSPAPSSIADYVSAGVYCSAQGSGTLTFTASSTPTADLTVNVMIID